MIPFFRNIALIFVLFSSFLVNAQEVVQAEYYWDTDPGQGSATPLMALDGNLDEAIEDLFENAVSIPAPGLHTFNVRVKGLDNTWGNTFSYVINVGTPALNSRDAKVIQAEYFWDTDPGQGSATTILALDGNLDEVIEDLLDGTLASPPLGLHTFNIRVKGQDNSWSNLFTHVVNVMNQTTLTRDAKIIQAEYFWDTDPGQGSAIPILALDGNLDEVIEDLFDGTLASPPLGLHTFNLRVRGQDNTWSNLFTHVVNVKNQTLITRDIKVIQAEYFWDTDPGQGSATTILALDGNLDEAVEDVFENAVSIPTNGLHTFNIRVLGQDNSWSNLFSYVVNVGSPTLITRDLKVVQAEYFWDTDPGEGNASPILALDGNFDEAVEDLFQNSLASTTIGLHVFHMRVKGVDNTWSSTFKHVVNVLDSNSYTSIDAIICDGNSYTVPSGNATYSAAGMYNDTLTNINGFDSIITINLSVTPPTTSTLNPTACGNYTSPALNVYTSTGTYFDTISNAIGCDSIITINLTILPNSSTILNIGACDSYTSPSGNYTWTSTGSYLDTLPNAIGCDSILTINLIISSASSSTQTVTACDAYTWVANGTTYSLSGNYTDTLSNTIGCDSIVTLDLTIYNSFINSTTVTTCDSYVWAIDGNTYSTSGIYTISHTTANGCDSIQQLDLTILNSSSATVLITSCDSYLWALDGNIYTASGTYTTTIPNSVGCDSIVTLDLTINTSTNAVQNIVACDSYFWAETGLNYLNSGTYTQSYTNIFGCDSLITLNLNLGTTYSGTETLTACDSYFWAATGITYTSSGVYSASLLTPQGCDSLIDLDLTITNSTNASVNITACDTYVWAINGNAYSTSGLFKDTIVNAVGCDSIITLNLTINVSTASSQTITACDSYMWPTDGITYTNTGIYTATLTNAAGCDSIVTLDLTIGNSYSSTEIVTDCESYTWAGNGATYTASGFYTATFVTALGCDSVLNLDLTINSNSTDFISLTTCDLYTWPLNGNSYASSGIYLATIPNAAGCDSVVTLDLTITNSSNTSVSITACDSYFWPTSGQTYNVSGSYPMVLTNAIGCDSIVTLDLTVGYNQVSTDIVVACDNYVWPVNGNTYSSSGIYSINSSTALGCDSIYTLDLTIGTSSTSTQIVTACDSYTWPLNGLVYTLTGNYIDTIANVFGCDSIVTLDLTVNTSTSSSVSITACDSYTWPVTGTTYSTSGNYAGVITNSQGCDSTITLNLTINSGYSSTMTVTNCGNYIWPENGSTYTSSGLYSAVYSANNGCDSTIYLDLTIGANTTFTENITSCGPYLWALNGQTYSTSGMHSVTIPNSLGCDSIVTLNLTVNAPSSGSESVTTCSNYFWSVTGMTYSTTGSYTGTLTNAAGCDSTVTLNLTMNSGQVATETLTACNSYTWAVNGTTYTSSGMYSVTYPDQFGCDSTLELNLTINSATADIFQSDNVLTSSSGDSYEWIDCGNNNTPVVGETSQEFIATWNSEFAVIVTSNGCTDTSACVTVDNADLKEFLSSNWQLYPNPTHNAFTINLNSVYEHIGIVIKDASGRIVFTEDSTNTDQIQLELDEKPGVYFVTIQVNDKMTTVKRLVLLQ